MKKHNCITIIQFICSNVRFLLESLYFIQMLVACTFEIECMKIIYFFINESFAVRTNVPAHPKDEAASSNSFLSC